jgi:hypothetical protein
MRYDREAPSARVTYVREAANAASSNIKLAITFKLDGSGADVVLASRNLPST